MHANLVGKLAKTLVSGLIGVLVLNVAHGGLFVSEKEIERKYRLQWLDMKKHMPIVQSQRVQNYVSCVAGRIVGVLDESFQELDWEVVVFDDPQSNAQVMPGGKIAVYAGILDVADSPDALAAVLGHEVAHLTQGHVLERERRASRADALTIIGNAATGLGGMVRDATTLGFLLPFNREQETESDAVGMQYMAEAGYDPRAAIYLWRKMDDLGQARPPEFASSHPAPETRMNDLVPHLVPALEAYNAARETGRIPNCGP
jgi:predicted Zn-dependent protease